MIPQFFNQSSNEPIACHQRLLALPSSHCSTCPLTISTPLMIIYKENFRIITLLVIKSLSVAAPFADRHSPPIRSSTMFKLGVISLWIHKYYRYRIGKCTQTLQF